MATAGPNQATAVVETDAFEAAWSNDANAVSDDNSYATVSLDDLGGAYSNYLDFTSFGFALAGGDTITNVQVEVACKTSAGTTAWNFAQLIKGGSVAGDSHDPVGTVQASESYLSDSQSLAQWNLTLSAAEANASNFGVRVAFQQVAGTATVSVDACRITITYTPAAGAGVAKRSAAVVAC